MLALLCTAPSSSLSSPVEGTTTSARDLPPPPPPRDGVSSSSTAAAAAAGPSTNSFPLSNTKLSTRRPSIRKRIQSLSRVSTATLSNAAGSSLSFFRHASGSGSSSSSASSPASGSAGTSTSGSGSAHLRGASTSSFASGKSTKSWKSNKSSGSPSGYGRLNVLHIGAPSAFKHQFHLGPSTTSDRPWDESRWRQIVEMRGNVQDDTPVIDVVPPTSSTVGEPPRVSTSSDRNAPSSHARSASQPASISSPNLLSITTSPCTSNSSSSTPTSATDGSSNEPATTDKAKRQAKRASLVKRKPVPQLNPEDIEPLPNTPAHTQATFVLMPDPTPSSGQAQGETVPAGRTSFEVSKEDAQKEALEKLVRSSTVKERPTREKEPNVDANAMRAQMQVTFMDAPEHIFIRHPSPPPKPPPRRHTLAHMQARALGRGMSDGPSLPSGPSVMRLEERQTQMQTQTQERKRSRARPIPIVAPSPSSSPGVVRDEGDVGDVVGPAVPPGLSIPTRSAENEDNGNENELQGEKKTDEMSARAAAADNSPRPSLSSLASTSESTETARSGSTSSTSSCDLDLEMEPRTPTDERRVSAGSASSFKRHKGGNSPRPRKNVRIVVPGHHLGLELEEQIDADVGVGVGDDGGDDGEDVETPKAVRRASSKRRNPPARRVEANEESVYVTADEAEDL